MPVLDIEHLSKYFGEKEVLHNISFKINKGTIFGLLGPNGAGKTTLIHCIAGLVTKDSGNILICGYKNRTEQAKKRFNVVPGFSHLNSAMTIDEFLQSHSCLYTIKDWREKRQEVITLLELQEIRQQQLKTLSSGYKQRALLAKALLTEPQLLLMDEPTVGLDVVFAIKMRNIIKQLKKRCAILLTTHNMNEAEELCDEVGLIMHGKILKIGNIQQIKKQVVQRNSVLVACEKPRQIFLSLKKEEYIISIEYNDTEINITIRSEEDLKKLLKILSKQKQRIYEITTQEPTLEQAYITLTNR